MQNNNLDQLIETAPLLDSEKFELKEFLAKNGENEQFYALFNQLLIDSLRRTEVVYCKVMKSLQEKMESLETKHQSQMETLEHDLENKLAQTDPLDTDARDLVWEDYYAKMEKYQHEYQDESNANLTQLLILAT